MALSLSREVEGNDDGQQRVLVIGDGDFVSNSYLGNAGNLDLSLSMVNWLSRDDAYVSIPVRAGSDQGLNLSGAAQTTIAVTFMLLIPVTMVIAGVAVWWRRRKF